MELENRKREWDKGKSGNSEWDDVSQGSISFYLQLQQEDNI